MDYIIYQTAFIGDIILSTSIISTIKKSDPESRIIFVTTPVGESILCNDKRIERIIIYDKRTRDRGPAGLLKKVKEIRGIIDGKSSVFISLHRFIKASIIGYLSGAKIRAGFKGSVLSFLYNRRADYRFGIHEIERNFELLSAALGDATAGLKAERPELFFQKKDYAKVKNKIKKAFHSNAKIVSIAPGSVWATKRWPAGYFMELIHALDLRNIKVILIGGKEDIELCRSLGYGNTLNLAGELSLLESAAAISLSAALVTNDSAPLHLASAVNTPSVAIFGATILQFGFGPLADGSLVLGNNELKCRPCGRHGAKRCAKEHFACMKSIAPGMVTDAIIKILE
jgi:heptosyltransferase II